jgi:signal transduction histidine kinase
MIFCDDIEIEQVIINLISNAIDAAENGDENWIKIKVFDNSKYAILQISDSGLIIPDKIRDKIFEPFFTTKPVGEGTGLGLSIAKGILDEHNAVINMSFSPNTCFEICFPKV